MVAACLQADSRIVSALAGRGSSGSRRENQGTRSAGATVLLESEKWIGSSWRTARSRKFCCGPTHLFRYLREEKTDELRIRASSQHGAAQEQPKAVPAHRLERSRSRRRRPFCDRECGIFERKLESPAAVGHRAAGLRARPVRRSRTGPRRAPSSSDTLSARAWLYVRGGRRRWSGGGGGMSNIFIGQSKARRSRRKM